MIFGRGGITFRKGFSIYLGDNAKISIGSNCFFNHYCSINSLQSIEIGEGCIFGEGVKLYDHNHKFTDDVTQIKDQGYSTKPIKIGNHCWLGSNVVVLKGCSIGNNCVIGAGCIITKDIPDNSLVTMNRELCIKTIIMENSEEK